MDGDDVVEVGQDGGEDESTDDDSEDKVDDDDDEDEASESDDDDEDEAADADDEDADGSWGPNDDNGTTTTNLRSRKRKCTSEPPQKPVVHHTEAKRARPSRHSRSG